MAEVYLARLHVEGVFHKDVVIKRLFRHLAEHESPLRMFHSEARLLASLSHPSIPQVYDLGYTDGHWFLAMEHVEGITLRELLQKGLSAGIPMPLSVALTIVIQAADALHHAHERTDTTGRPMRIVHRDVTPDNIMVTREGVVKVLDFGVAQSSAREESNAGVLKGTFAYMAPEQVRGRQLDKRADVFALGVVFYELTTGTRLFRGTDVQVMTSVVEQDVPAPSSHWPEYPPELEAIVLAALIRDRSRRLPSAAHFASKLEEFAVANRLLVGNRVVGRYFTQVHRVDEGRAAERATLPDAMRAALEHVEPAPSQEALSLADVSLLNSVSSLSADVESVARHPSLEDTVDNMIPELDAIHDMVTPPLGVLLPAESFDGDTLDGSAADWPDHGTDETVIPLEKKTRPKP